MSTMRRATHSGTWYSSSGKTLSGELEGWLSNAERSGSPARAIIAPHAGYSYCGACGAHAYKQVNPANIEHVFILGPSHHAYLPGCALTTCTKYQTPLYDLDVDQKVNQDLMSSKMFETMSVQVDEDEHSIEMHLPYIAKVMESKRGKFTIVPVLVGALDINKEQNFGRLFSTYLADPRNLFVVSSDFCHWGKRFRFTYYDKKYPKIYQSIEAVDRMGMDLIEQLDPQGFAAYLKKYSNTICGRHPIAVLLNAITIAISERQNGSGLHYEMKFLQYAQSNQCKLQSDSSVSYAAAALTMS
ncbi:protein MEMO1 [Strongylocentrotus purpuratus]|uniref:Protein MEMO1 n=1 Tax=Strongylocentrotus purpuratus TaxID=7668 RepID=A0A7M7RGL3_STRPU|nr:protein MEMO1 [Strongylocentrotus purpuratus]